MTIMLLNLVHSLTIIYKAATTIYKAARTINFVIFINE